MEINFYKDLSRNRDKLAFERIHNNYYDSKTLLDEIMYRCNINNADGFLFPIDTQMLRDIIDDYSDILKKEMEEWEYIELTDVANYYDYVTVKIEI